MSLFRLLLLLCLAFPAWGQDWPARTVKFVSPYPPGGSVDPLARLFEQWVVDEMARWGKVVRENAIRRQ